ncbi:unnamed protein product [Soboliphyme baturini]|uniref:Fibrous sheath-interacting protein 1 n=1 Tax=Soboliphyme baturini TaxID=241478 RepID=A0A183IZ50_9BILA|nr:unnamed protein product [Soboliphyme baturini]
MEEIPGSQECEENFEKVPSEQPEEKKHSRVGGILDTIRRVSDAIVNNPFEPLEARGEDVEIDLMVTEQAFYEAPEVPEQTADEASQTSPVAKFFHELKDRVLTLPMEPFEPRGEDPEIDLMSTEQAFYVYDASGDSVKPQTRAEDGTEKSEKSQESSETRRSRSYST